MEWCTSFTSIGLLSFYSFALVTTPDVQRDVEAYKLLVASVLISVYMRMCYFLHTVSKTYAMYKNGGPLETQILPFQRTINSLSSLMFIAEPAHFVCVCWITHLSFPFKELQGLSYWAVCTIYVILHVYLCVCVLVCVCVCVCVCVYIYIYIYVCVCIYIYIYIYIYACVSSVLSLAYLDACMTQTMHEYIHTYMILISAWITYIHTYIHRPKHPFGSCLQCSLQHGVSQVRIQ